MALFKAFIRVVKSVSDNSNPYSFTSKDVIREPIIEVSNKDEVKQFLLEKYPQFFINGKVYERETKDQAQFFYVVIYPLYNHEVNQILEGEWICHQCGQIHDNKYVSRPMYNERLFPGKLFCRSEDDICLQKFKEEFYRGIELPDDESFIKKDSPNYIYKITEKSSGKSYVGKTRNAPFFRWWNHLTHSSSPFGTYLRSTSLMDWNFEVLAVLPFELSNTDVLRIESEFIIKFNCIDNGFNSLISNKSVLIEPVNQTNLFSNEN